MKKTIALPILILLLMRTMSFSQPVFLEQDEMIVIDAEAINPVSPWKLWTENHAPNGTNFTGSGYFVADDSKYGSGPVRGKLEYRIKVSKNMNMKVNIRGMKGTEALGCDAGDHCNDIYAWMEDYSGDFGSPAKTMVKSRGWAWKGVREHGGQMDFDLEAGKVYSFKIAARSGLAMVDRIAFWTNNSKSKAIDLSTSPTPIEGDGATDVIPAGLLGVENQATVTSNNPNATYFSLNGSRIPGQAAKSMGSAILLLRIDGTTLRKALLRQGNN